MEDVLVISCIFGTRFHKIYQAPILHHFSFNMPSLGEEMNGLDGCLCSSSIRKCVNTCVFFTNNRGLEEEIVKKGWTFVYVSVELTNDDIVSSLQSKYVKFLQVLEDFPEYKAFSKIVYADHKFQLLDIHIERFLQIHAEHPEKAVIIRKTPRVKTSIYEEIHEAKQQYRYLKHMDATVAFVEKMRDAGEIDTEVRISNTGILFYNLSSPAFDKKRMPMLREIYKSCMELQQPECQIFWAMYSQKYMEWIQQIEFEEVKPVWACP
jgi:hypothetical protein